MELSFRFINNGTAHDDLILQFGDKSYICDSYYLALDQGLFPDREDSEKVRAVFRRLLEQWLTALEHMPDGGSSYLPYDYSDQCTGWLECLRVGGEVIVSRGWADIEGYSISPSDTGNLSEIPRGFCAVGPTVRFKVTEFTDAIRRQMD